MYCRILKFIDNYSRLYDRVLLLTCFAAVFCVEGAAVPNNLSKGNKISGLSANITVSNVSFEYFGFTFYNLSLGYGLFYNGSVFITPSGGAGPYSYQLLNPPQYQQNGYFTGLGPGNYHFVITDAAGQVLDTTVTVGSVYPLPGVSISNIVYPSSCASNDGSFMLTGSGGQAPYTYSVDGGTTFSTNNTFNNLNQGYYPMILVKDANGQVGMTGFSTNYYSGNFFNSKGCSFVLLTDLFGAASCGSGQGGVSVGAQGGSPPIEFSIDGISYNIGNPVIQSNGTVQYRYDFINLSSGTHVLYGKDASGNVSQMSVPILNACNLSIVASAQPSDCQQNNGTVLVIATNGSLPYSYTIDGKSF